MPIEVVYIYIYLGEKRGIFLDEKNSNIRFYFYFFLGGEGG